MTTLAVLLAAAVVAGEPTHHAAPAHHAAASAQESERKLMEQAMHRQLEYEQRLMHAQQQAVHEQMKAQIHAQAEGLHAAVGGGHSSGYAGRPYGSVTRPYYGGYHNANHHRYHHYQHHRSWPIAQDREQAGLLHLKQSLDHVRVGRPATSSEEVAIEHALMRVVEVTRTPSVASIARLAGHLTHALADRESAPIDTSTIALALRAGVNAPLLIPADRVEAHNELQTALKHGHVHPGQLASVLDSLKTIEHQEQARR